MTLALLSMALIAGGCKKEKIQSNIAGEWHCSVEECDIYLAFDPDGTFELYQKLGEGRYYQYNGSWSTDKNIVSGTYDDGTPWGSSYEVEFDGSDKMTFSATNGSGEVNTYTRTSIPEEVRNGYLVAVKGEESPLPAL